MDDCIERVMCIVALFSLVPRDGGWGRRGLRKFRGGPRRPNRERGKMDLQVVLAHPKVTAVRFEGDQSLATVFYNAFNDTGKEFPIDFDTVWQFLEYSTKGNAVRKLKNGGFKEGIDYSQAPENVITSDRNPPAADKYTEAGRPVDKYYLTKEAFQLFAMAAAIEVGDKVRRFFRGIRDAYIDLTQRLQPGNDRKQAHILTYDKKNCIYVGAIQQHRAFASSVILRASRSAATHTSGHSHHRTFSSCATSSRLTTPKRQKRSFATSPTSRTTFSSSR
jgi:hypothetical protein